MTEAPVRHRQRWRDSFALALALALALGLGATADVHAAEPETTVVLLQPERASAATDETLTRTKNELVSAGFRVVVATREGADTRSSLTSAMTGSQAVAAIAIEPSPGSTVVEVWVSDGLTGKLSIRQVDTAGRGGSPSLLAIRAVELLRASLIELSHPARDATETPTPPEPVRRLTTERDRASTSYRSGFGVEAGAAGLLGTSPVTPSIAPMLRLSWCADLGLGARLSWIGPTAGPSIGDPGGAASVTEELLVGEIVYAPPLDAPIGWLASAGLGILHVDATGELADPRREKGGGATVLATTVSTGVDLRLHDHFGVSLETFVGATAPAVVIDIGDAELGSIGQPLLGVTLGALGVF